MTRKDKVSMDCQAQIFELHTRGYSVRRIAQALKMCRRTVRKYIKNQDVILLNKDLQKIEGSTLEKDFIVNQEKSHSQEVIFKFPEWLQHLDWKRLLNEKRKEFHAKFYIRK